MEQEEPVCARGLGVHVLGHDACWHVVHYNQPVKALRMIFSEARGDTCASVMADKCNPVDSQVVEQCDQILRHIALVIPTCWFIGFTIAPQIRRNDAEFLR
jgi:hypothetical protein